MFHSLLFLSLIVNSKILALLDGESNNINIGKVTKCGQTLAVDDEAMIEYKVNDPTNFYGICAWIIRMKNAGSIKFGMNIYDFDSFSKVTLATLVTTKSSPYITLLHSEDFTMNTTTTLPGTIAIITLATSLEYKGTLSLKLTKGSDSTISLSTKSVDVIYSGISGTWKHPKDGYYDNHEISTFLLTPPDNVSKCIGFGCIELKYNEKSLEAGCFDRVDVFHFIRDFDGGWIHASMLCNGDGRMIFHNLGELILVTFASDRSGTGQGFDLEFQFNSIP